jgi:release factor glutamine methyltransferase
MVVESALKFLGIDDMATGDLLKIPDYDKELTDIRFADFCTGTGCIGISVANEIVRKGGKVSGYLIDISDTAIDTASYNVESQAIRPEFINVMKYDVTCNAPDIGELDFIVSNPPYISNEEMNTLDKGVKDYEPDLALRAGDDGLDFYHPIIESAKKLLRDGGALIVEHGYGQGDSVREIFESAGLKKCMTIRDYGGNDRVTLGIK